MSSPCKSYMGVFRYDDLTGRERCLITGHQPIMCVGWCPHGVTATPRLATGSRDQSVAVWEVVSDSIREVWRMTCSAKVDSLAYSRAGSLLALGLQDGAALLVDVSSTTESWQQSSCWQLHGLSKTTVTALAWSGEETLFTGSGSGVCSIRCASVSSLYGIHCMHMESLTGRGNACGRLPPHRAILRVGGADVCTEELHTAAVRSVSWHPDGSLLTTGSLDSCAQIVDAKTLASVQKLPLEDSAGVYSMAWHPSGDALACHDGEHGDRLRVVDKAATTTLFSAQKLKYNSKGKNHDMHKGRTIFAMAWKPDGTTLLSGDYGGVLGIWRKNPKVADFEAASTPKKTSPSSYFDGSAGFDTQHSDSIMAITWSPDGQHFATGSFDTDIRIFNFEG